MSTSNHLVITKLLAGAAIALGSCVIAAAPAGADTNPIGTDPNPFGALSSGPRETAPTGGPAVSEELERGIRAGSLGQPRKP